MSSTFCAILVVLIGIQTVLLAETVAGHELNLHMCTNNNTIAVQVMTGQGANGAITCQCQAGPSQDPSMKEDYVHTPGIGSHKIHPEAKNWNDARKICNDEGAHLAIINSKAEEAILVEMLKKAVPFIKGGLNAEQATLGIHDLYKEGEWVTIFGESLYSTGFAGWSPTYWGGQPDNHGGNQNCGTVIIFGGLDDVNCNDKFAFICELPLAC